MAKKKKVYSGIGGQAVMEGIMMKNKDRYAVAVRRQDGKIEVMTDEYTSVAGNSPLVKVPFIRGIFMFIDSMVLGLKTLTWSASFFDEEPVKPKNFSEGTDGSGLNILDDKGNEIKNNEEKELKTVSGEISGFMMGCTIALSIVMAVCLFMLLPYFLSQFVNKYTDSKLLLAAFEGVIRLVIFILYIAGISAMKDIKRVYMYHGAEHKCINCIERGWELNVKNVMRSSRQHKRCGTSFLLFVMFVSIVLFLFIRTENPVYRVLIRVALIPVISGISYEIIRLAGKTDNIIVGLISKPGLWLQKLTTREPDEDMVEVAIKAVEAVFDWREYLDEIQKGV